MIFFSQKFVFRNSVLHVSVLISTLTYPQDTVKLTATVLLFSLAINHYFTVLLVTGFFAYSFTSYYVINTKNRNKKNWYQGFYSSPLLLLLCFIVQTISISKDYFQSFISSWFTIFHLNFSEYSTEQINENILHSNSKVDRKTAIVSNKRPFADS